MGDDYPPSEHGKDKAAPVWLAWSDRDNKHSGTVAGPLADGDTARREATDTSSSSPLASDERASVAATPSGSLAEPGRPRIATSPVTSGTALEASSLQSGIKDGNAPVALVRSGSAIRLGASIPPALVPMHTEAPLPSRSAPPEARTAAAPEANAATAAAAVPIPPTSESEIAFITGISSSGTVAGLSYWTWQRPTNPPTYSKTSYASKWGSKTPGTAGGTVKYWFDAASNWTTVEQNGLVSGLSLWSAEANISFAAAASASTANVVFVRGSDGSAVTSGPNQTNAVGSSTEGALPTTTISIDTSVYGFGPIGAGFDQAGGYPYDTLVHEEGHMIGFGHGGPYNDGDGGGAEDQRQYGIYDSRLWTLMSYIEPEATDATYYNSYTVKGTAWGGNDPSTPMLLDILAAQRLYGAPTSGPLTSGGQVFGFNCNIAGTSTDSSIHRYFDFTTNTTPVVTLWDAGTGNTLDLSGYAGAETIDLAPGTFSSCAGLTNNIAIAEGTTIATAYGGSGGDTITGSSTADTLYGDGGNDTLIGAGGADHLDGGAGNDTASYVSSFGGVTVSLASGTGSGGDATGDTLVNIENIWGSNAADTLTGDGNANILLGEGGDDLLKGGGGADHLDGGSGNNTASYLTSASGVTVDLATGIDMGGDAQGDTLVNIQNIAGSNSNDLLIGDGNANSLLGENGNDILRGGGGADHLDGGTGTNTADYITSASAVNVSLASGTGTGGDAQGDTLVNIQNLTGSYYNDTLIGDGNANTLSGANGDDLLKGGGGADILDGGGGNNAASYLTSTDAVIVDLATGSGSDGDADGDTLLDIQNLYGSNGDDTLIGDDNANTLLGEGGDDLLKGGGGADHLDGGAGNNTASYVNSTAGVTVSLTSGTGTGGEAQGDTLVSIQNLSGSGYADTLIGDGNANALSGLDGNDTLIGGGGADRLDGGTGNNTASYTASFSGVTVSLASNTGLGGDAQGDTLVSIQNLTGSGAADALTGDGNANILLGQGGNDTLVGGAGADYLDGGTGTNTSSYAASTAGVTVNLATGVGSGGDAQGDTLVSIQNLTGSNYADTLTGDGNGNGLLGLDGDDTLTGNGGADYLNGGAGTNTASYLTSTLGVSVNLATGAGSGGDAQGDVLVNIQNLTGSNNADTLTGDGNANSLSGQGGNDTLRGGAGADHLDGGTGSNTATYDTSASAVTIGLSGTGTGGDAQGDTLVNIQNLTGSNYGDTLTGDGNANTLLGLGGNDVLKGGGGADYLDGGTGNNTASYFAAPAAVTVSLASGTGTGGDAAGDTLVNIQNLTGSNYGDTLAGDGNANTLSGGDGDDTLKGGGGADVLYGGAGINTASYFTASAGVAVSLASGTGSAGDALGDTLVGIQNLTGSNYADTLTGDGYANTLSGEEGNDTLIGGDGSDALDGGDGFDDAVFSFAFAAATITATGNGTMAVAAGGATDSLSSIEELTFTDLALVLGSMTIASGSTASNLEVTASGALDDEGALVIGTATPILEIGPISGAGTLAVLAGANVTFAGQSTYTGATSVQGTLAVGSGGSLTGTSQIALTTSGAVLDVASAASGVSIKGLAMAAGSTVNLGAQTLTVAGNAALSGSLAAASGGILVTMGTTTVSGLVLNGLAAWRNGGTVVQSGAAQIGDGSGSVARIVNAAGKTYALAGDVGLAIGSNAASGFTNAGTLAKTAGTGVSHIAARVNDTGTITVASGALEFDGASSSFAGAITGSGTVAFGNAAAGAILGVGASLSVAGLALVAGGRLAVAASLSYGGAFNEAAGALLSLGASTLTLTGIDDITGAIAGTASLVLDAATAYLETGAKITTAGVSVVDGAVLTLDANAVLPSLLMNDAAIALNHNILTVSGTTALTGSSINGAGTATGAGTLSLKGGGTLSGVTIDGGAILSLYGASSETGGLTLGDVSGGTASLVDQAGSTFTIGDDSDIAVAAGGAGKIVNAGTLTKATGVGRSMIGAAVNNTGTIEAASGTLDLAGAITGTGQLLVDAAATLEFGSTVASAARVGFNPGSGGTLQFDNAQAFAGTVSGFGSGDTIDLTSIGFSGMSLQYADTTSAGMPSGTLTVSDGTHTAAIHLAGPYTLASFTAGAFGVTGTAIGFSGHG